MGSAIRLLVLAAALAAAAHAAAQAGLKLPERSEPGLDPRFARGWFAPEYDRFGFVAPHWRDPSMLAGPRMQWSYAFGDRASLGISLARERDAELEHRPLSVFGRYWFTPNWAVSAESLSSDPLGLLRLQDFRIGVQRRF